MATEKPGFIFERIADVPTRERWFHEFLGEHPTLLDEVGYVQMDVGDEPVLYFSARAAKGFLAWCLRRGYGDAEEIRSKLDFFEEAH